MVCWYFKFYQPEDAESQPQTWYERQGKSVQGQFDGQLFWLSLDPNAPESAFQRLPGYDGLWEIVIEIELSYGAIEVMPVGFWQPDSPNFVVVLCCEMVGGDYDPPLYQALEYKKAWEERKGEIYDHIADGPGV